MCPVATEIFIYIASGKKEIPKKHVRMKFRADKICVKADEATGMKHIRDTSSVRWGRDGFISDSEGHHYGI